MDKTTKEKRDRDEQVASLQIKIKELEDLVKVTKNNENQKPNTTLEK